MKLESVTLNVIFFSKTLAVCLIDKRKLEKKVVWQKATNTWL